MTRMPGAGRAGASFRSVVAMWNHRVASTPDAVAFLQRQPSGPWTPMTWHEANLRVRAIAAGLLARGLAAEDRVAIVAQTSVDWILADLGTLVAGGANTPVFPGETPDRVAAILADSRARWAFCDTDATVDRLLAIRDRLPHLDGLIVFDGRPRAEAGVVALHTLEDEGTAWLAAHPTALNAVRDALGPDRLATLLYTSGTMGEPKGVELTHDAWVYEAEAIDALGVVGPTDCQLLFLPLAHVFSKVMEVASIRLGIPTAVDGRADRLAQHLMEVRPTWLAGVPRVYERIRDRILDEASDRGRLARFALDQAIDLGARVREARRRGTRIPLSTQLAHAVAERTVFAPLRARLGGQLRFLVSGGAPLPLSVGRFFDALGIAICEGYGLTESAAASFVNTPDDVVLGTVGRPVPGCEVRIADDGEVLIRSRGVMRGYHGLPEATAEALDADGWLHTGDLGVLLPSGHLRITDRKKSILVLANGKKVAPSPIAQALVEASPLLAHASVHGDRRPYCVALLSLDPDSAAAWGAREGVALPADPTALATHPEVCDQIRLSVESVNRDLAGYEAVRRFAIVPEPFTQDNGLLTPTLKVRGRAVEARFRDVLDDLYGGSTPA